MGSRAQLQAAGACSGLVRPGHGLGAPSWRRANREGSALVKRGYEHPSAAKTAYYDIGSLALRLLLLLNTMFSVRTPDPGITTAAIRFALGTCEFVVIPGTAKLVEVMGDYDAGGSEGEPLPANHVRSPPPSQQFRTPKRRPLRRGGDVVPVDFGAHYPPGGADVGKTTMAAAGPDAAVGFAVQCLGAARVQQHRGAVADGQCAKLAWAQWPDTHGEHQWHAMRPDHADWVSLDHLCPAVPFAALRDLRAGVDDQWLDYRDIFDMPDLASAAGARAQDGMPFLPRSAVPGAGSRTCSLLAGIPGSGMAVEVRSETFTGLEAACAERAFDLSART